MKAEVTTVSDAGNSEDLKAATQTAENIAAKNLQRWLALFVGGLAILLPTLLFFGPIWFGGCKRYSISHFYYSPVWGSFFIGTLVFIGTYLSVYSSTRWDEWIGARIAAVCTFVVAFLPTTGHGCLFPNTNADGKELFRARAFAHFSVDKDKNHQLLTAAQDEAFFELRDTPLFWGLEFSSLHYIFAGILFFVLLYFCWRVFTRTSSAHEKTPTLRRMKRIRNSIYIVCGALILLSISMLGWEFIRAGADGPIDSDWNKNRQTFLWEAVALCAFGLSWLTKGKFLERIIGWLTGNDIMPAEN